MKAHLVDLEMVLHHETQNAVLVSVDGSREAAVWLPKSAVEFEELGRSVISITLPEALAIDKGLV